MAMQDSEAVDTYGLPVYKVNKVMRERVGDEMHILLGYEMFGRLVWTCVLVMTAEDVVVESQKCQNVALQRTHDDIREVRAPHH